MDTCYYVSYDITSCLICTLPWMFIQQQQLLKAKEEWKNASGKYESYFTGKVLMKDQLFVSMTEGTREKDKKWLFPKNHTYKHVWDDILSKGVTRGANTKYNKNMHKPLKDSFQW